MYARRTLGIERGGVVARAERIEIINRQFHGR
jgi:hypothetical protein